MKTKWQAPHFGKEKYVMKERVRDQFRLISTTVCRSSVVLRMVAIAVSGYVKDRLWAQSFLSWPWRICRYIWLIDLWGVILQGHIGHNGFLWIYLFNWWSIGHQVTFQLIFWTWKKKFLGMYLNEWNEWKCFIPQNCPSGIKKVSF